MLGEFEFIAARLKPLAAGTPGALDLEDDAALLDLPAGMSLVLTKDAMVAGVHFLHDDPPGEIAKKLLRVNLSDLAAMGAAPLGYLLALARAKETPESWLADFCRERLPRYMVPEIFDFRDELPKSSTGKIARAALETQKV